MLTFVKMVLLKGRLPDVEVFEKKYIVFFIFLNTKVFCNIVYKYLVDDVFPRYEDPGLRYGDIVDTAVMVLPPANSVLCVVLGVSVVSRL